MSVRSCPLSDSVPLCDWLLLSQVFCSALLAVSVFLRHLSLFFCFFGITAIDKQTHQTNKPTTQTEHPWFHLDVILYYICLSLHVDDIVASLLLFVLEHTQGR